MTSPRDYCSHRSPEWHQNQARSALHNIAHATRLEAALRQFPVVAMVGPNMAAKAASNYRMPRSAGFTRNKIAVLLIGTFCIEHGHVLVHCDTDLDRLAELCGLQVL